jgi:class 3 adenylate cyclase
LPRNKLSPVKIASMSELPGGTVTFLFSDIEASTQHLKTLGEAWGEALAAHNSILRTAFADAGGREVDRQGDAFFAVFPTARAALTAAADAQRALVGHEWPGGAELRVRMGVHTGEPSVGGEGYLGVDVVRAARICAAAHGGQVLVSESTRALVGPADLQDLGLHHLKDMEHPERLFQLELRDLPQSFPALRTLDRPETKALVPMPGREAELAARATALAERLKGIEELGPAITRHVQETLAQRGIPTPPPPHRIDEPSPKEGRSGGPNAVAIVVPIVTLAALVLIVYLITQAF